MFCISMWSISTRYNEMERCFYEIVGLRTCQLACSPSTHIHVHFFSLIQVLKLTSNETYTWRANPHFNPHFILGYVTQRSHCGITVGLSYHDAPTLLLFIYLPVWPWRVLQSTESYLSFI